MDVGISHRNWRHATIGRRFLNSNHASTAVGLEVGVASGWSKHTGNLYAGQHGGGFLRPDLPLLWILIDG